MKFLDTNVIVYAFLNPKRTLKEEEKEIKNKAKRIIQKIESGERVFTTIVHISEIANIFGSNNKEYSYELISRLLENEHIIIHHIDKKKYMIALQIALEHKIDINDGVAIIEMHQNSVNEIYSFDSGFDKIKKIIRREE